MQGGVGAYSQVLARALVVQGQEVCVFSNVEARAYDDGIAVKNAVNRWTPFSLQAVNAWARAEGLDVISLQFQTACYGMSPWIHFLPDYIKRIPVVTTFHDLRFPYLFPKAGALRDWIVLHLARTSDGTIVTNQEDFDRVRGLPNVRLIPIGSNITTPLPIDFDPQPWCERAGVQPGDFLVAHFGFMKQGKGIETLLESIAKVRTKGIPARLLMIGGRASDSEPTDVAYTSSVDKLIDSLGLTPHVHWTGYLDEQAVSAYLKAADVVTLPFADGASYRRGSLMAAVHHGCAIVTTTPQFPTPAFVDGENMLLVSPGDSRQMAGAIHRLYDSPTLRARLQQGAVQLARHFDWSQIACNYIDFFKQLTL